MTGLLTGGRSAAAAAVVAARKWLQGLTAATAPAAQLTWFVIWFVTSVVGLVSVTGEKESDRIFMEQK